MKSAGPPHSGRRRILGVHPNVFFLGVVSFLTDVSSEMIFTLLPLFLSGVLGVKATVIGFIEGVADSTATILKIVSGWLSDKTGKRKFFALCGYGLSTIAKPFMYLATAWGMVLGVRFADRLGKGIRSSPRDALVADFALANERGKSFGFHRALDSLGAVVGLSIAALIVFLLQKETLDLTRHTYQRLVLIGVIPAVLAVLVLFFFVQERRRQTSGKNWQQDALPQQPSPQKWSAQFKIFLVIMVLFTLGNSSDAFLVLRARDIGSSTFHILLMLILFNIVYALASLPSGILSDRMGRKKVIAVGWLIYAAVYLGFAMSSATSQIWPLFALYGIYYGATEGVARAFVADVVATERRGTAYGLYYGAVGITILPASIIAGWLWQAFSPSAPFFLGAVMAVLATLALLFFIRR